MKIKVLIVDDTVIFRKILSDAAGGLPNVEVVGTAPSGAIALKKLAQSPADLVLLDVHMEGMDGIQTLTQIRLNFPQTMVVMVSGISTRSTESTIRALELGALDFIRKPDSSDLEKNLATLQSDLAMVLRHVETRLLTRGCGPRPIEKTTTQQSPKPLPKEKPLSGLLPETVAVIAIGVSTGGPEALSKLIPNLPLTLGVPILLVQHMPPHFTKSLADSLSSKSAMKVREAEAGDIVSPDTVYIAPGGQHMVVEKKEGKYVIGLNSDPPENSCRPSVDVLFRSVAEVYGEKGVLCAILTGMGSDGLLGVRALKSRKCYCLSQTEATCVVYGMPRAIDEAHFSNESVDIDKMAERITEITTMRRFKGI